MQHLYSNKEVVISRYKKATYCLKRHSTDFISIYDIYDVVFQSLEIRVQLHFIHIIYFTKINRSAYLSSILGGGLLLGVMSTNLRIHMRIFTKIYIYAIRALYVCPRAYFANSFNLRNANRCLQTLSFAHLPNFTHLHIYYINTCVHFCE